MKNKLVHWSMQASIFLLRSAGWVAVGIVIGFIVSFFFRPIGRVDTFAFAETMLGVVITGLAVVGAFIIALQWSNLDRRMHEFDIKVKETTELFGKQDERVRKVAQDTDEYIESTIGDYNEKVNAIYKHFEDEIKIAEEINTKLDEYKILYVENEKSLVERQEEFERMI